MKIPFDRSEVSQKLLAWYGRHGRDLPWRQTRDPYRIWLSEIMLQQTTVAAVIPYYEKFLAAFPDVDSLAASSQEEVLELWSGLGYYSRARNLHKAAQHVVESCLGQFPEDVEGLMALPGIGRSTAGAIVSIAYDRPAPILDGNVRRVLVRLMALRQPPREREAEKKLWQWAAVLTPEINSHDYAQAIMDLGATICTPRKPECAGCPLDGLCQARQQGVQDELPVTSKKAKIPIRRQKVLLLSKGEKLLVRRRPEKGLLGGMWEFPCFDPENGQPESWLQEMAVTGKTLGQVKHVYSHFRLEAEVCHHAIDRETMVAEDGLFWHDATKLIESPLHGAHQKALEMLKKEFKDE